MEGNTFRSDNGKRTLPVAAGIAAILILCAVLFFVFSNRDELSATTMRLIRFAGEVSLTDAGGERLERT